MLQVLEVGPGCQSHLKYSFYRKANCCSQIDFEAVTAELGYKNVAVARANFNRAWKKHFKAPDGDANSPPKASTKAKVIKRKATNTADGSSKEAPQTGKATKRKAAETADGSSKEAPKRKRVSKAAKKIIKPDPTDDEAEDETNVKEEAGIEEDDEGNGNEDSNANEQTSTNSGEA